MMKSPLPFLFNFLFLLLLPSQSVGARLRGNRLSIPVEDSGNPFPDAFLDEIGEEFMLREKRDAGSGEAPPPGALSISRDEVILRAQFWSNKPRPYSQSSFSSDPSGKMYRTDCSGYVSMAWDLSSNLTTRSLPSVSTQITKDQLQKGDILLGSGHVVIFSSWANLEQTRYNAYEQGSKGTRSYAIAYPYWKPSSSYRPYRYNNIY